MKIGELAKARRFRDRYRALYERQGLLPPPQRQASGYRRYESSDVARLRFIRRAKALGFTLGEVRDLLALSGRPEDDMGSRVRVAGTCLNKRAAPAALLNLRTA